MNLSIKEFLYWTGGMVEYWSGSSNEYGFPRNVRFESKVETDLYEFAKENLDWKIIYKIIYKFIIKIRYYKGFILWFPTTKTALWCWKFLLSREKWPRQGNQSQTSWWINIFSATNRLLQLRKSSLKLVFLSLQRIPNGNK